LGIRYDYEKASNDYLAYKNTTKEKELENAFKSKLNFNRLTPKVALQYTFDDASLIYFSASNGYKTGGFNSSFEKDEDRSFQPEYSWNYEAGAKGQFFQNRIKAEICVFYIDWKNQQISRKLPVGSMQKNAGRSESKGVEVSLQGNLFKGFSLLSNWGYTRAVFKEYKYSETDSYDGKHLPLVPSHTFMVGADYKIPLFARQIDCLTANFQYTGVGRIYWYEDNAVSQPYYGQLNGQVSATKGAVSFSIWAKNITNTEYTAFYFTTKRGAETIQLAQKGKPFTLGASVSVKI
jgi:outer membrane receptor protein involved in Fe transport